MSDWQQIAAGSPLTVLYTPLDSSAILGAEAGSAPAAVMLAVGSRWLEVEPDGQGGGVVRRLISGNPQDYLHPAWQPGSWIQLGS